jgi:hypothetical protein
MPWPLTWAERKYVTNAGCGCKLRWRICPSAPRASANAGHQVEQAKRKTLPLLRAVNRPTNLKSIRRTKMAQPAPAPMDDLQTADSKTITIQADGTYSPTNVTVNNGGEVKFVVDSYPTGMDTCSVTIGSVTFSASGADNTGGTVKVGS